MLCTRCLYSWHWISGKVSPDNESSVSSSFNKEDNWLVLSKWWYTIHTAVQLLLLTFMTAAGKVVMLLVFTVISSNSRPSKNLLEWRLRRRYVIHIVSHWLLGCLLAAGPIFVRFRCTNRIGLNMCRREIGCRHLVVQLTAAALKERWHYVYIVAKMYANTTEKSSQGR